MKKRILPLILAFAMVLTLTPAVSADTYALSVSDVFSTVSGAIKSAGESEYGELLDLISQGGVLAQGIDLISDVRSFSIFSGDEVYNSYLDLGDSTAFGYGLKSDNCDMSPQGDDFGETFGYGKAVSDSWTYKLAEKLDIDFPKGEGQWYIDVTEDNNHYASLSCGSMRFWEMLNLVEDFDESDGYNQSMFDADGTLSYYYHCKNESGNIVKTTKSGEALRDEMREHFKKNIKNADLITISLGGNDLMTFFNFYLQHIGTKYDELNWDALFNRCSIPAATIERLIMSAYKTLKSDERFSDMQEVLDIAEVVVYAFLEIAALHDDVLDDIHTLNPDAKVVITGLIDPYADWYYEDENGTNVAIGSLIRPAATAACRLYKAYALTHSDWCAYADFNNIDVIGKNAKDETIDNNIYTNNYIVEQYAGDWGKATHQSVQGHEQCLESILGVLGKSDNPFHNVSRFYRLIFANAGELKLRDRILFTKQNVQ